MDNKTGMLRLSSQCVVSSFNMIRGFELHYKLNYDNLTYVLSPADDSDSYNSNSFAYSLIRSAGMTVQISKVSWTPGWGKRIPMRYFEVA